MLDLARAIGPNALLMVGMIATWSIVTTIRNAWEAFVKLEQTMVKDFDA